MADHSLFLRLRGLYSTCLGRNNSEMGSSCFGWYSWETSTAFARKRRVNFFGRCTLAKNNVISPPSFIRCSTITAHLGKDEQLPGTILTEIKAVASQ